MRFDEVELQAVPFETEPAPPPLPSPRTPVFKHALALLTDLSLFAALSLALSPLLPQPVTRVALIALSGFVLMLSFYYFAGAWTLWGKTVGGAIFDVRMEKRTLRDASLRWLWMVGTIGIASALTYYALN
jgi:uncharacterized RDD family membrane protein YckC